MYMFAYIYSFIYLYTHVYIPKIYAKRTTFLAILENCSTMHFKKILSMQWCMKRLHMAKERWLKCFSSGKTTGVCKSLLQLSCWYSTGNFYACLKQLQGTRHRCDSACDCAAQEDAHPQLVAFLALRTGGTILSVFITNMISTLVFFCVPSCFSLIL